eukprot:GHVU01152184.1.p1 GENE.GHVU01152184.1~~GHVU01152184.1.p1  ORF type:complete len:211 (+),score=15.59 GHVU01152184.1:68-700(+)
MTTLTVEGGASLWDVTRKCNALFITDDAARVIHVITESNEYVHNISLSWKPRGIDIQNNTLFVVAYWENAVYQIILNETNHASSIVQVTPSNALNYPIYISVYNNMMTITHEMQLILASLDGRVTWSYGGSYGGSDGQFKFPYGVHVDSYGRYVVADNLNKRVQLISANGTFVQYVLFNMEGYPLGLMLDGNTLFISQQYPTKLYKFVIN